MRRASYGWDALPVWQRRALQAAAFVAGWVVAYWLPAALVLVAFGVMAGLVLARWAE